VVIISITPQGSPNVTGQRDDFHVQFPSSRLDQWVMPNSAGARVSVTEVGPLVGAGQGEPPLVIAGGQQGRRGTVLNVDVGEAAVTRAAPTGVDRLHQLPPQY
jgi:hypothetical protein